MWLRDALARDELPDLRAAVARSALLPLPLGPRLLGLRRRALGRPHRRPAVHAAARRGPRSRPWRRSSGLSDEAFSERLEDLHPRGLCAGAGVAPDAREPWAAECCPRKRRRPTPTSPRWSAPTAPRSSSSRPAGCSASTSTWPTRGPARSRASCSPRTPTRTSTPCASSTPPAPGRRTAASSPSPSSREGTTSSPSSTCARARSSAAIEVRRRRSDLEPRLVAGRPRHRLLRLGRRHHRPLPARRRERPGAPAHRRPLRRPAARVVSGRPDPRLRLRPRRRERPADRADRAAPMGIWLMDVAGGQTRAARPAGAMDGSRARSIRSSARRRRDLYFLSDARRRERPLPDGHRQRRDLPGHPRRPPGVTGITRLSPALSVAERNGRRAVLGVQRHRYQIHALEPRAGARRARAPAPAAAASRAATCCRCATRAAQRGRRSTWSSRSLWPEARAGRDAETGEYRPRAPARLHRAGRGRRREHASARRSAATSRPSSATCSASARSASPSRAAAAATLQRVRRPGLLPQPVPAPAVGRRRPATCPTSPAFTTARNGSIEVDGQLVQAPGLRADPRRPSPRTRRL